MLLLFVLVAAGCAGPKLRYSRNRALVDPEQAGLPEIAESFRAGERAFTAALHAAGAEPDADPARHPAPPAAARELFGEARDRCWDAYRGNPDTTVADRALFYCAEAAVWRGETDAAQRYYELLLDHFENDQRGLHPTGDADRDQQLWRTLLLRQLRYGRGLLDAARDGGSGGETGVAVLRRLVAADPHSPRAAEAFMELGLYFEWDGEYEDAAAAYQQLLTDHKDSPLVADALYRRGQALVAGARGVNYDLKPYLDAENAYEERLSARHGPDAATERALVEVRDLLAQRMLRAAEYYARRNRYTSALTTLEPLLADRRRYERTPSYAVALARRAQYQAAREAGDDFRSDEEGRAGIGTSAGGAGGGHH